MTATTCVIKMLRRWEEYLTWPVDQTPECSSLCMCRNLLSCQTSCHIPPNTHHSGWIAAGRSTGWSDCMHWKDFQRNCCVFCQDNYLFYPEIAVFAFFFIAWNCITMQKQLLTSFSCKMLNISTCSFVSLLFFQPQIHENTTNTIPVFLLKTKVSVSSTFE